MKNTLVMGLLILFSLAGCAVGGRPTTITNPLPLCDDEKIHVDCIKSTTNNKVSELKLTRDDRPTLGLTFSGGGSKSSPFVMGVLKRFVDEGWIYKTQYLSSVSGGSYTAFYLYYRAYKAVQAYTHETEAQSVQDYLRPDPAWPGLRRYFVDARANDKSRNEPPFISMQSPDYAANPTTSLAAIDGGCENLTRQPSKDQPPPIWQALKQEVYQGWVECYQDLLMTHQAVLSSYPVDDVKLGEDFWLLWTESSAAAPAHWVANVLFDWKKRLSPTQYDYLYGIERTYAYLPGFGEELPKHLHDETFRTMSNCLDFYDMSIVYTADPTAIRQAIGGYLPKWIIQATGASGNIGLDLSQKHYNLEKSVFEITFDEYGSGQYHYVQGSPSLIGLTVPFAVLSSSAFADTAQRSVHVPRGAVNFVLQTANVRWGFDVANYNVPTSRRIWHSVLPVPFYYISDPVGGEKGPTIHLSDGGQSGDNLGMVSMFRRGVKNIVVVAGEDDFDSHDGGFLKLGSLCAANYYLIQHGYEMKFHGDPRNLVAASDMKDVPVYRLAEHCTWDDDRYIYLHPSMGDNLTPFNWKQRVWVADVVRIVGALPPSALPSPPDQAPPEEVLNLEKVKVYYINSALDKDAWLAAVDQWYPKDGAAMRSLGSAGNPKVCSGVTFINGQYYSCTLLAFIRDTHIADLDKVQKWTFPQTGTAFTTYSNSINLFRAYRDLGWLYARELPFSSDEMAKALNSEDNPEPVDFKERYKSIVKPHHDPEVCKDWKG